MKWKRKVEGGVMAFVGYMLSPLSWWNDLFVNVPLAVGFGWLVSWVYRPAFAGAVILGYWLTNLLGFVLMHHGLKRAATRYPQPYSWRSLGRDMLISLLYTALLVLLIRMNILQPVTNYLTVR